ncbi:hypothetical protein HDU67_009646 [Dinochytrium kinnereticum]|nr:hypothetical protein HDU67_009646 [Dinochytrium kinnereticum]
MRLIQMLFDIVKVPLKNYKGRLRQIVLDDKGLTLLMIWGLPPSNAMDHALALFCSLALRASPAEFSIGVSSGPTFIGVIGNKIRSDFNLFGRSINIAARCMSLPLARKGILCDLMSIDAKSMEAGGFEFSDPIDIELKGVESSMKVAVLRTGAKDPLRIRANSALCSSGPNHSQSRSYDDGMGPAPILDLVGREMELRTVDKILSDWTEKEDEVSKHHRSAGMIIFGKSGCGKTSVGKYCDHTIVSKTDSSKVIIAHAPFYALKLLISQVFDQLLLSKEMLKASRFKVESYLRNEQHQRSNVKKGRFHQSGSLHSIQTSASKADSDVQASLNGGPAKSHKQISARENTQDSLPNFGVFPMGNPRPDIHKQLASELDKRVANILEILDFLGFADSPDLVHTDEILNFLGLKVGYVDVIRGTESIQNSFKLRTSCTFVSTEPCTGSSLIEAFRHLSESGEMLEMTLTSADGVDLPELQALKIRFVYLIMLADYYWEKQIYWEALVILKKLFDTWEMVPSLQAQYGIREQDMRRPEFEIFRDKVAKAKYAQFYSHIYRASSELEKAYDSILLGFEYLEHDFPKTDKECVKYGLRCLNQLIRCTGEMRRFLRYTRRKGECITMTVDYVVKNPKNDVMNELLGLMTGNGILVDKAFQALTASIKTISLSGNIFLKPLNTSIANSYLYSDVFRSLICGTHTAASIALLVFEYGEMFISDCGIALDEFPNFLAQSSPIRPDHLKSYEVESKPKAKSAGDSRTTFPVRFEVIGTPPPGFSLESATFLFTIGHVARNRDLFEMEEKYLRLASVILFELKREQSYASATSSAFYRELMFFSGDVKIASLFIDRLKNCIADVRFFKPYFRSEGCHFAVEALDFESADTWESEYCLWSGLKGFQVVHGNGKLKVPGGGSTRDTVEPHRFQGEARLEPEIDAKLLPPFLRRDTYLPFIVLRVAKIAVAVEKFFDEIKKKGLVVLHLVESLKSVESSVGAELEMIGKDVDELLKRTKSQGPNIRFAYVFRVVTFWHMWAVYTSTRIRWLFVVVFPKMNTPTEATAIMSQIDILRCKLSSTYCRTWSKIAIAFATASRTYLTAIVNPMHQGAAEFGKGRNLKAVGLWKKSVQVFDDLTEGRHVHIRGLVGEFTEPNEWRGVRYFGYHRECVAQRVAMLESLDFVKKVIDRVERGGLRRRGRVDPVSDLGGSCVPEDWEKEWKRVDGRLVETIGRFEKYSQYLKLEAMMATSMRTFLKDLKGFA